MSNQSDHKVLSWDNNQVPSSGAVSELSPSELLFGGADFPKMELSHWSDQLPSVPVLRDTDRMYVSRLASLEPDVIIEVGAGAGLHATGLIAGTPKLLAYVGVEPGSASASMLRKNIKTVAHTLLRTELFVKVIEGAAAESYDLFGMTLTKQQLNQLKTSPLDSEVFFNSPQEQASIAEKGASTTLSKDYKAVTCYTVGGIVMGVGEPNNPSNYNLGLIDAVAAAQTILVKVCAPASSHRVIEGAEALIDLVEESNNDPSGAQELLFSVEAKDDWDMRGTTAVLSAHGFIPVEASEVALYGGYTAKLFCRRSQVDAYTIKWCA